MPSLFDFYWEIDAVAVALRLARYGVRKNPFYRVLAIDRAGKRNGKYLEIVGTYNPMTTPPTIELKEDRIKAWILSGAKAEGKTRSIIEKKFPGMVKSREEHQKAKTLAARKARKARAAGSPKKADKKAERKAAKPAKKVAKKA